MRALALLTAILTTWGAAAVAQTDLPPAGKDLPPAGEVALKEGPCVPSETVMCLNQGRFQLTVAWRDFKDRTGEAKVVQGFTADDSGLFYFFNPNNWEMLVKVLDACNSSFNTFWVFSAATTNVEYTLTVTDTQTDAVKTYFNPLGTAAPAVTDTGAFATCP